MEVVASSIVGEKYVAHGHVVPFATRKDAPILS